MRRSSSGVCSAPRATAITICCGGAAHAPPNPNPTLSLTHPKSPPYSGCRGGASASRSSGKTTRRASTPETIPRSPQAWRYVQNKPGIARYGRPSGWLAEGGRSLGQPEACSGRCKDASRELAGRRLSRLVSDAGLEARRLYRQCLRSLAGTDAPTAASVREHARALFAAHADEIDAGRIRSLLVDGRHSLDEMVTCLGTAVTRAVTRPEAPLRRTVQTARVTDRGRNGPSAEYAGRWSFNTPLRT